MCTIPLIKLSNLRKRRIFITHHRMPNGIYMCILPHAYYKSPERTCRSAISALMNPLKENQNYSRILEQHLILAKMDTFIEKRHQKPQRSLFNPFSKRFASK